MSMHKHLRTVLLALAVAVPAMSVHAEQWYFYVKNATGVKMTKLQVSTDKSSWGNFDIGGGIKPGETAKLIWDASTNDEPCEQWIRASYADGGYSPPSQQNFCENLDDPLEFGE